MSEMMWTNEMESTMIELIRRRESLWNVKNDEYHKRNLKNLQIIEICNILIELYPAKTNLISKAGKYLVLRKIIVYSNISDPAQCK